MTLPPISIRWQIGRLLLLVGSMIATLLSGQARAVCATVKIQIVQELTLEREAFDARLQVFNQTPSEIEDLLVTVTFADAAGQDRADVFFTNLTSASGMSGGPDGNGTVPGGGTADIHWLIIPSPGAGGEAPEGQLYLVGATLSFVHEGQPHTEVMQPDTITVLPMPLLQLDYFLPAQVIGDDPWTPETEPPIPYPLGVRVANNGFGAAQKLQIESGQPEIVDNDLGLLIAFVILGSEVNGAPSTPSLLVNFGDLPAGEAGVASWEMISTLSGQFLSFEATLTHDDALGGEMTSLVEGVETHTLTHEVVVDLPGRDTCKDFLGTQTQYDLDLWVFESDNVEGEVVDASDTTGVQGAPAPTHPTVRVTCDPQTTEPFYAGLPDPGGGHFELVSVYRADGKRLLPENAWLSAGWNPDTHVTSWTLGIFDHGGLCDYLVTYDVSTTPDTTPPVTQLRVLDPHAGQGPVCVTPQTPFVFLADDDHSAVSSILMALDGDPAQSSSYFPAISPFRFELRPALQDGPHSVHYHSTDASGNVEASQTLAVRLDSQAPVFTQGPVAWPTAVTPQAPPSSGAARYSRVSFRVDDVCGPAGLRLEVAPGAVFSDAAVIDSLEVSIPINAPGELLWAGTTSAGEPLPPGVYSLRLTPLDGLGHQGSAVVLQIEVLDPLGQEPAAPMPGVNQIKPVLTSSRLIWQDDRTGDWDLFALSEDGEEQTLLASAPAGSNQTDPAATDTWLTWLDDRDGLPRVWVMFLPLETLYTLGVDGEHGPPSIDGDHVVFDVLADGQWDLYMVDLQTWSIERLTTHERDQRRPVISGDVVVFEDYRDGATPELYALELSTGLETRLTAEPSSSQWAASLAGGALVWMDDRHGGVSIYSGSTEEAGGRRLTGALSEPDRPDTDGRRLTFVDAGTDLVIGGVASGAFRAVSWDGVPRQQAVVLGDHLAWSQKEGGYWQIYHSRKHFPDLEIPVRPGFNLVALPPELLEEGDSASGALSAWSQAHGITGLAQQDDQGAWRRVDMGSSGPVGADFTLVPDRGLVVYGGRLDALIVEELGPSPALDLGAGVQSIGIADLPYGYGPAELAQSLGVEKVQWVRHLHPDTGALEVLVVDQAEGVGVPFPLIAGEGVLTLLTEPVSGWRP